MEIVNHDQAILASNLGGQTFGTEFNAMMFHTLTASLYKDKPRAVAREAIANAVDAQRERNFLFVECYDFENESITDQQKYDELIGQGFAPPNTGWEVHIPTDIEPWMSFKDNGIGLRVEQIIGEIVKKDSGEAVLNPNGSPLRKGGVYTTLFGSDKRENNRSIGAYGLGCKSPYSISDTFLVTSIVGGEKHKFLMYLSSNREPMVDWLTQDSNFNPTPELVDEPNGLEVRIDGIPVRMFQKLKISISEILQTFPKSEQPLINGGYYEFEPLEFEHIQDDFKVITKASYGSLFTNKFVVNTGGVVYPVDHDKYEEFGSMDIIFNYTNNKCVMLDMPLGTVAIPPSREEISYDDHTVKNIRGKLDILRQHIQGEMQVYLDMLSYRNVSTMVTVSNKLKSIVGLNAARLMIQERFKLLRSKINEQRDELGYSFEVTDEGTKVYFRVPEGLEYGLDYRCYFPHWKSHKYVTSSVDSAFNRSDELRLTESVNDGCVVILVDDNTSKPTLLNRINAIRGNYSGESDLKSEEKHMIIIGCDRLEGSKRIPTMEDLENLASRLSTVCGVDYMLSSEVNETFQKVKKELVVKNRISKDEVQRNVKVCKFDLESPSNVEHDSSRVMYVPEQFYENGDTEVAAPYYYMKEEEWNNRSATCNTVLCMKERSQHVTTILGTDRIFIVKGVRTQSIVKFNKSADAVLITAEDLHSICKQALKEEYEKSFLLCREMAEIGGKHLASRLPIEFNRLVSPISIKNWGLRSICGAYVLQYILGDRANLQKLLNILKNIEDSRDVEMFRLTHSIFSEPNSNAEQIVEIFDALGVDIKKLVNFISISHEINTDELLNPAGRWYHRHTEMSNLNCQTYLYKNSFSELKEFIGLWGELGYAPYLEDLEMINQFLKTVAFFGLSEILNGASENPFTGIDEKSIDNIGADVNKEIKKITSYVRKVFSNNQIGLETEKILQQLDVEDTINRLVLKATPFGRSGLPNALKERVMYLNRLFNRVNAVKYKIDESSFKPYVQGK